LTKARDDRRYGAGHEDGLDPLAPLDLAAADGVDAASARPPTFSRP